MTYNSSKYILFIFVSALLLMSCDDEKPQTKNPNEIDTVMEKSTDFEKGSLNLSRKNTLAGIFIQLCKRDIKQNDTSKYNSIFNFKPKKQEFKNHKKVSVSEEKL